MANKYSENWKDSWNEEEWQGRSQNKIQGAYKIAFVSLIVIFVVSLLYYVLNQTKLSKPKKMGCRFRKPSVSL